MLGCVGSVLVCVRVCSDVLGVLVCVGNPGESQSLFGLFFVCWEPQ